MSEKQRFIILLILLGASLALLYVANATSTNVIIH
jgi:hypothetical protein